MSGLSSCRRGYPLLLNVLTANGVRIVARVDADVIKKLQRLHTSITATLGHYVKKTAVRLSIAAHRR
jgi:hypothetical protein